MNGKLIPTGECWCGCGEETSRGAFFISGHDKRAEAAVTKLCYGDVPHLLDAHGFGPDGRNASKELAKYQREGGAYL